MEKSMPVNQFPLLAQFALQHVAEMIVWAHADGSIIYANAACRQALGYTETELLDQSLPALLEHTQPEAWAETWRSLKKKGQREVSYSIKAADSSLLPVKAREFLVEAEDQHSLCFFWELNVSADSGMVKEISPQKERLYLEEIILKENSSGIISKNRKYRKVLRQVEQVADTQATVLIEGETGTGKELLANAIHQLSGRRKAPFIKINCAAIPEHLAGSELFGHEKGAFTGAFHRKIGRFELADGGTLLLDEIGELPIHLQSKLLRVLQEGEFERLGGNKTIKVDVRLIAATNRNLKKMIDEGKFREDLYFRLSVFPIHNLPLRERKDDIPLLVKFFIEKFNQKMGRKVKEISGEDLKVLMDYNFPGNIRELENIIERAIILSKGEALNLKPFLMQQQ